MPYILSPCIPVGVPGLFGEGPAYERSVLYDIHSNDPAHPPVNYGMHSLRPHSIPHVDFPAHIIEDAATAEWFFQERTMRSFYGPVLVVQLQGGKWVDSERAAGSSVWRISEQELRSAVQRVSGSAEVPEKLFITARDVPRTKHGFHDSRFVLVLSESAAHWLASNPRFNAFGTSWKSSDFEPASRNRPVHRILLRQALLFEQLKLDHVPEGQYFLSAFPLPLEGASESPCTPVLFEKSDWPG
ncbi:MAG: hypothetical protein QY326_03150 [Bdellovibrionota bacterium]|nr:MAG: hypothetical protein QY326_03150 [Bdellovibrionota bacterium]